MCQKSSTFADDFDEPTALATDVGKNIPILEGEVAERFIENMRKNEEEYERRKNLPPTLEELKKELSYAKMFLKIKEQEAERERDRIKNLEEKIKNYKAD